MKILLAFLLAILAPTAARPAHAALVVLTCEPEWAALVEELAGDRARIHAATTAMQDPHRIEARPALIAQARRADLLVCTGAELEVGWLPLLQRESGNARIQAGRPGYFEASAYVPLLEKPADIDRSAGDVHAAGNPHIHLNPHNLLTVAEALAARLQEVDAANGQHYADRHARFKARLTAAIAEWEEAAKELRGMAVVVHHRHLSYLCDWLGLQVVADLEPKPGVDPSAAHLGRLLTRLEARPAAMVLRVAYQSARPSEWIATRARVSAVVLPYTVGGTQQASDLFTLFDDTLARLKAAR
jgi:zinc/manganese transport system substrate-binding protein